MNKYIQKLIEQGENEILDFKFQITDSKKIAKTLVAFANTKGGQLLIGVKDNGSIAGIRTEEEYYMIETAASLYCKPEIFFNTKRYSIDGKSILLVTLADNEQKPYLALNDEGLWRAYYRMSDQNILVNRVQLEVWKRASKNKYTAYMNYNDEVKLLLSHIQQHQRITVSDFMKIASIKRYKAEQIIINLILMDVLQIVYTENSISYIFKEDESTKTK